MTSHRPGRRRIAVLGAGLVGRRTARILAESTEADVVLIGRHRRPEPLAGVTTAQGWPNAAAADANAVVLATASQHQYPLARRLLRIGCHVITTADGPGDVSRLLLLDTWARRHRAVLVVGAAYSPGLSTLLALRLMASFDSVHSVRTAQFGTGGPACARQHHRAMGGTACEIKDAQPVTVRGGSGRELVWFPEPVGAADCYRAALSEPVLLHRAFPDLERIEARQAATRRDRLTSRLPMLRAPHAEGLLGAVWAEVRGTVDGRVEHRSLAATGPQATGAAAVAAAVAAALGTADSTSGASALHEPGVRTVVDCEYSLSNLVFTVPNVCLWAYDASQIQSTGPTGEPTHAARKWDLGRDNRTTRSGFRSNESDGR